MTACVHSCLVSHTFPTPERCADGLAARFFLTGWLLKENHNFISRRILMARPMQALAQAPKPDSEVEKLHAGLGRGTSVGC